MANRNFARAMRRKTQWAGIGTAVAAVGPNPPVNVAAAAAVILSAGLVVNGGSGLFDEETTVTRMIGEILVLGDDIAGPGAFAVGCVVARGEAITAGVASLPSPAGDPDAEWLYYYAGGLRNVIGTGPASSVTAAARIQFDVRSQRILRAGSNVVWIAFADTDDMEISVNGRYLVKLT